MEAPSEIIEIPTEVLESVGTLDEMKAISRLSALVELRAVPLEWLGHGHI
jgi:hypothetical protein